VFDSQLRWCDQVTNVCKKMSYYVNLVINYDKSLWPLRLFKEKNPLYANATIVALTYACIQRHVSHKWNILFINGFHHVNPW